MNVDRKSEVYVVGHKNPDTDSICSAIAYANLKQKTSEGTYTAKRVGQLNAETEYVLKRFGVDAPTLLSNVRLQVQDVDFENALLTVRITKNRNALVLPLNHTMVSILKDFLKHRQHKSKDDWLFCNIYGQQLVKTTCYRMLAVYNKKRGVETTGIHRFRHTFAKQWILNGGNVVTLSKLLGHSSLNITQNYINLLTTDLSKQVEEINLLDKYAAKKRIKM